MSDERKENSTPYGSPNDDDQISLLEAFDRAVASLPLDNVARERLLALRAEIAAQEEMVGDAREMIEKLEQVIKKVTSPANRIGTFLGSPARDTAQIVVGGADYYCNVDPRISLGKLQKGTRVLVNEAYVIVGDLGFETAGPVTKVAEVLGPDRLRVGAEHGTQSLVLQRSAQLAKAPLKAGDDVRVDANYRVALELLASPQSHDHYLDEVPELPWEKVGGQEEALQAIRDAIELPLLHEELFQKFQHATPKGFLLYGPPGCGKTLIGKATAYNLTKQLRNKSGADMREYFMHIKGPEILNMWVGESERMVREIFATAREKRREGYMPFLFIDEAESILGTRRASRYSSILSTLVPMFCTEMDGIDSLNEVVIILASNRADLIDPAILRPGRIDRKIKVKRPNKEGAREIYRIYLTDDLPYDAALLAGRGIESGGDRCAHRPVARDAIFQAGRKPASRSDPAQRSEGSALPQRRDQRRNHRLGCRAREGHGDQTRPSRTGQDEGISEVDLQVAYNAEYLENEILPATDITEDWLKLIDYDPDNVVKISPVRLIDRAKAKPSSGVI